MGRGIQDGEQLVVAGNERYFGFFAAPGLQALIHGADGLGP